METINLAQSGRIERFIGKRLKTDLQINPQKIIMWVILFAYVPIVIITAYDGTLLKGEVEVPFLMDYFSQFRALIAVPLLIMGRKLVNEKLLQTNHYVADTLLDENEFKRVFAPAVEKLARFNQKGYDEAIIILILIVYSLLMGQHNVSKIMSMEKSNWACEMINGELTLTTAAKWQLFISTNIFRFIIVRWIWMYGCWVWILIKISGCKFNLALHHADRVCGLNMLVLPLRAFNNFFVALAIMSSGNLINKIVYEHENLESVKMEIVVTIVASFVFLLAPYLSFTKILQRAKNDAELWLSRRSAELSKGYQKQFVEKQPVDDAAEKVDASVMSDFNATYDVMLSIKPVPFSVRDVIGLAIPIALVFLPTLLSFMTIKELFNIVINFIA